MEDLKNEIIELKKDFELWEDFGYKVYRALVKMENIILDIEEEKLDIPYHEPVDLHKKFMEDVRKLLNDL